MGFTIYRWIALQLLVEKVLWSDFQKLVVYGWVMNPLYFRSFY